MWLFTAVPVGYRRVHGARLVTKQAKSMKDFPAFAAENPAATYAAVDLDEGYIKAGGAVNSLKIAGEALGGEAEQVRIRAQVAATMASRAEYEARQLAGFKAMQLKHQRGCPYRLLEAHKQHVCTCGYKVEE